MKHSFLEDNKNDDNIKKTDRKVVPVCFLCDKVPGKGIRSGFFLKGIFICQNCEEELLKTSPHDKEEEYLLTLAKFRRILFQNN